MSMGFIGNSHNYDPGATRDFFTQAIPKVTRGLGGRETRKEGFSTEKCEAVAKRIVHKFDQPREKGKYVEALADILRVKLQSDDSAATKTLETILYEALSEAFKSQFEKATYNGSKVKHAGKDLFTRPRAQAKAQRLAYEVTSRLLKDKRADILGEIFTLANSHMPTVDLRTVRVDKDHLIRTIKPEIDEVREATLAEADAMFEEIVAKCTVLGEADKTDTFVTTTISQSKWDRICVACSSMQVPFSETLSLGSSKTRGGSVLPAEWGAYRSRAIEVADRLCLRAVTQQTIDPFFRVARTSSGATFDAMLGILKHLGSAEPSKAVDGFLRLSDTEQTLLKHLLRDLSEAVEEMPDIADYSTDILRISHQITSDTKPEKRAEINKELAPLYFLTSLASVKHILRTQVAKVTSTIALAERTAAATSDTSVTSSPLKKERSLTDSSVSPVTHDSTDPSPTRSTTSSTSISPVIMTADTDATRMATPKPTIPKAVTETARGIDTTSPASDGGRSAPLMAELKAKLTLRSTPKPTDA